MEATTTSTWVEAQCGLCGASDGTEVLAIPHPDAPGSQTYLRECARCGLRRLTPRPGDDVIGTYYEDDHNAYVGRVRGPVKQAIWNFLRDVWARPAGSRRAWLNPFLAPIAQWAFDINVPLNRVRGLRVVEMGCGFGDLLIYLKSRGCLVEGVDFDLRASAKAAEYDIPVHVGDLRSAALTPESFDVGIMCHSLEHVPDPAADVREFARILRPGGTLHIAVPNGRALGLDLLGAAWTHVSLPLHFWFFDSETLTALLERNGFSIIQSPYSTSRTYYVQSWLSGMLSDGPFNASRTFARYVRRSRSMKDSGDVLRIVAVRKLGAAPSRNANRAYGNS